MLFGHARTIATAKRVLREEAARMSPDELARLRKSVQDLAEDPYSKLAQGSFHKLNDQASDDER